MAKFSHDNRFDIVIVRPPLVYGPNAPGNFGRLVRLLSLGVPLPLGGINNVRSFIGLDNFVDLELGDYVVHNQYGIGRFLGLEKIKIRDLLL